MNNIIVFFVYTLIWFSFRRHVMKSELYQSGSKRFHIFMQLLLIFCFLFWFFLIIFIIVWLVYMIVRDIRNKKSPEVAIQNIAISDNVISENDICINEKEQILIVDSFIKENANIESLHYCSNCGHTINPGAKFCSNCGKPIISYNIKCPKCDKLIDHESKFCENCGAQINL